MSYGNVKFQCPSCGKTSEAPTQYIGTEDKCPFCGKWFRLVAMSDIPASKPNCLMCYLGMFRQYLGFRGRARRREFWWAFLFNTIVNVGIVILDDLAFSGYDGRKYRGWLILIYLLASFLPLLAIQVRRLHDTNKSGWWVLLSLMPVLNIAYLVWLVTDGDRGDNRFGRDPKGKVVHHKTVRK